MMPYVLTVLPASLFCFADLLIVQFPCPGPCCFICAATQNTFFRLGKFIDSGNSPVTILELRKPKMKIQVDFLSGESSLSLFNMEPCCYVFTWWVEDRKKKDAYYVPTGQKRQKGKHSLLQDLLIQFMKTQYSSYNHFSKAPLKNLFFILFIYLLCMSVLSACLYMLHMCARCPRMSEEGDSLELRLWMALSYHVGAQSQIQVLWKGNPCSNH